MCVALSCCSSPPAGGHPDSGTQTETATTAVIVGVQSEPLNGAIDTVRVVTTLRGANGTDGTFPMSALPLEVRLTPPAGDPSAPIGVRVEGYLSSIATTSPLLVRTAESNFVPGQTELLRVLLQGQCLLGLPGGPPGAPTCVAPETCILGACQSDQLGVEPYSDGWANNTPDICKPPDAGAPVVQVGTGQSDYLPVVDGQTVQAELGPQGGHHIWIAVRQENLKQSSSVTTITSVQPTTGLSGPKTAFVFTFDQDEGGFCKLAGLRYQLDVDPTVDYRQFLGAPLDVTVTIVDSAHAQGTGVAHLNIAPTILCPSGATDGGC